MSTITTRWLASAALILVLALPASAQQQQETDTEFASWHLPGWSFTPGLAIGVTRDTNVAVAAVGENQKADADSLFGIEPFGSLDFFNSRSSFTAGYRGHLRRYMNIGELNGFDQRARVQLRHLATKRLTIFAGNEYMNAPTTDDVMLNGLPFVRIGARTNSSSAGLQARLTKFTTLDARYELLWVDFDDKTTSQLTGGWVNAISANVGRRLSDRLTVGGEYSIRLADLNAGTRSMWFNDAGGFVSYVIAPHTIVSASAGLSHLADKLLGETRTAPYYRGSIVRNLATATIGTSYARSYIPSFGLAGSNESQELRGYVHMPIPTNRAYIDASAAWIHTVPYLVKELEMDSFVTRATVGYAIARWFRVEGFHSFTRQDTTVTGGEINRHRIGAQVVISQPMRIQ
jgi:hypothetical protein